MNRQQRRQAAKQGTTPPQMVKPIATLTLQLLPNKQVVINAPRNAEHLFQMLSGFFSAVSTKVELKEESKIITPPPGFKP